jgi:proteic killer suppression protein
MRFRFGDNKLQELYTNETGAEHDEHSAGTGFCRVMAMIQRAPDSRDFYQFTALHEEKLSGDRAGQHAFRLSKPWRLIIRIEQDDKGQEIVVIAIVDYLP